LPARAHASAYKVSKRRELDISAVSAGLYVETDADNKVTLARLAFGGLAATVKRAAAVEAQLLGQPWSESSVAAAAARLGDDFTPQSDHRGTATYRRLVARNLLIGFALEVPQPGTPALRERHSGTVQVEGAGHA
jgi:xanthine dehydrogenase iron-sulfur cluster and FAD-binding subunit A